MPQLLRVGSRTCHSVDTQNPALLQCTRPVFPRFKIVTVKQDFQCQPCVNNVVHGIVHAMNHPILTSAKIRCQDFGLASGQNPSDAGGSNENGELRYMRKP